MAGPAGPCGLEQRGDQLPLGVGEHLEPGRVFEGVSRPLDSLSDTP